MQLTSELSGHMQDAKFNAQQWRQYRLPKWAVALLVVAAFVGGWIGGQMRGATDEQEFGLMMSAVKYSIAAAHRAEGDDFITDRYYASAVDGLVRKRVLEIEANWLNKIAKMTSTIYWQLSEKVRNRNDELTLRYAERRLKLIATPTAETRATMKELGIADREGAVLAEFVPAAGYYSRLLGREVRAEQLVPDSRLRQIIDDERWSRKGKQ